MDSRIGGGVGSGTYDNRGWMIGYRLKEKMFYFITVRTSIILF